MTKLLSLFFAFFVIFMQGCKKKEPIDPHVVKGTIYLALQIHKTASIPEMNPDDFLPSVPKCDSLPISQRNLKVSIQPATKVESPLIQQCATKAGSRNDYFLLPGTQLGIDVAFYRGIKQVVVMAAGIENQAIVTAYGQNGRIIERQSSSQSGDVFFFEKNLDELKEITVVSLKGNLRPYYVMLNDQVGK
jgi:hypothetical protein